MAVPDLITAAQNGRNWRERNGEELYDGWETLFEEIAALLPKSRYAKVAPKAPFELMQIANGPSDMMMSMGDLGKAEPLRLAGLIPDSARFDSEKWQMKGIALSEQILATNPVQADPKTGGLGELLSDPVYNLK